MSAPSRRGRQPEPPEVREAGPVDAPERVVSAEGAQTVDVEHASEGSGHRGVGAFFAELPVLVLIAFVLALLLKTFLVQAFYIPSESMLPTLEVGDRVLVNKVVYDLRDPRRGEVIVFAQDQPGVTEDQSLPARIWDALTSGFGLAQPGERDFIKRIIGLPGETIEMRNGGVFIDGERLPEAIAGAGGYLAQRDPANFGPYEVPEGHLFVMGDNRRNSSDSRSVLGPIEIDEVIGRAFVVIWPLDRLDTLSASDYEAGGGS